MWIPSWLVAALSQYLRGTGLNPIEVYFYQASFSAVAKITAHLRGLLLYMILVQSQNV